MILLFSASIFAEISESDLSNQNHRQEIQKAIDDFDNDIYDENGSKIYKRSWKRLETSENDGEYEIVLNGFLTFLLTGSVLSGFHNDEVNECINRCMNAGMSYKSCKFDCKINYNFH